MKAQKVPRHVGSVYDTQKKNKCQLTKQLTTNMANAQDLLRYPHGVSMKRDHDREYLNLGDKKVWFLFSATGTGESEK